jgi:hypothetical protein
MKILITLLFLLASTQARAAVGEGIPPITFSGTVNTDTNVNAGTVYAVPDATGTNLFLFRSGAGGANNTAPAAVSLLVFDGTGLLNKWAGDVRATNNVNLNSTNTIAGITTTVSITNLVGSLAATTAYSSNLIVKASAGILRSVQGYNSLASSQFIHIYDRATVPTNGSVPVFVFTVPASGNFSIDFPLGGPAFTTGIVVANSTDGPTQTNGAANCWFTAIYK